MTIQETIGAYYGQMIGDHHRYRSWEHCYRYFQTKREAIAADRDCAALQLGFYLASWGMYRGSSFLLQHTYTAHLGVIATLAEPQFSPLWAHEFGAGGNRDSNLVPVVTELIDAIRNAYRPFAPQAEARQASDTLVTKVVLGTFGCLPACDRYFIDGFKNAGLKYSYLNENFVDRVLQFCRDNLGELRKEQSMIEEAGGMRYPLMKLVDMYFWQSGFDLARSFGQRNAWTMPLRF